MPGEINIVAGLFSDDREAFARFAGGGEDDRALLATQSLLLDWQERLLAASPQGALGGRRLHLFSGLARALLGPGAPEPGGEAFRRRTVSLCLSALAAEGRLQALAPWTESSSLARDILLALGELKRAQVPLARAALLSPVLADLAGLGALLQAKALDEEDLLLRACELLEEGRPPGLRLKSLLVHGFTDLSPLQARLLRALADRGVDLRIILPEAFPFPPLADLRRRVRDQFPGWPVHSRQAAAGPAHRLACFNRGKPLPAAPDESLIELAAEGEVALASLVARTIRARLAADPVLRPREICIVQREAAAEGPFIAALRRHGLPVAAERGPALRSLNGVGLILAALETVIRDWPRRNVLRLARGICTGAEAGQAEALARCAARFRVVGTKAAWETLLDLTSGQPEDRDAAEARLVLIALNRGLSGLPARGTLDEYLLALRNLISAWELDRRWWPGEDESLLAAYAGEMAGLDKLLSLLAEYRTAETAREKVWDAVDLLRELERLAVETHLPPQAVDGAIRCLNPSEIRGLRFRLVFLAGLAEGEFPKTMAENWLLPEADRIRLAEEGYQLDLRPVLAAREWQLLANVMAAADETLYLCWSRSDARGEGTAPSPFLSHLRERFAPLPVRDLLAGQTLPATPGEAWNRQSYLGRLAVDLLFVERDPGDEGTMALASYEQHRAEFAALLARVRVDRDGQAGDLTGEELRTALAARFSPERAMGVSALEDYGLCPYLFFVRRILGLDPEREPGEEPDAIDLGLAYHAALEKLFRRLGPIRLERREFPRYEEAVEASVEEAFVDLAAAARTVAAKRLLAYSRLTCVRKLISLLKMETRLAEQGGSWRISHAELGFGLGGRRGLDPSSIAEPLVVGEGAGRILLMGKIDRVDIIPGRCFRVYDYKRGRAPSAQDVLDGRTLQIPVYLRAAALVFPDLEPAGGGYFSLRDLTRANGLWRSRLADLTRIPVKARGSLDEEAWRETMDFLEGKILAAAEGIRAGRFAPIEDGCPPYCAYGDVCRK